MVGSDTMPNEALAAGESSIPWSIKAGPTNGTIVAKK